MEESKEKVVSNREVKASALEGVLFVARKNDMAFTVKNKILVISEHQSTINYNMPLRSIIYYGRTMERLIEPRKIYREKRIPIPLPEFYVFYNGDEAFPEESFMKLSDAYLEKTDNPMLELKVKVININLPIGHKLLEQCRPLYEYSWFIQQIKNYMAEEKNLDKALTKTIRDCEREGIMVDFVRKHGTEAVNMIFTQFNMEDALEVRYEEGFEDGAARGELINLIRLVNTKLQKGKSIAQIADEVEESSETVERIVQAIKTADTDEVEDIYKKLLELNKA